MKNLKMIQKNLIFQKSNIYLYIKWEMIMSFNDKFGSYITKLMTTILDSEQEEFVKDLALGELKRLNVDMNEFIRKNTKDISDNIKSKKQLLQEDK